MTTPMDAVERVAEAIDKADTDWNDDEPTLYVTLARAAIAAYRQSLEDAGMVVVPRKPTEAMLKAAWDSGWAATMTEDDDFSRWYRAMIAAAAPPADAK